MNIEIIKSLKERAKEMLEDNYDRKIGDEEIYTIICELENFYTAYEKEKEKNKELEKPKYVINCKTNEITKLTNDFVSKDKIKAKIEEVKEGTYDAKIVLESLLEKENKNGK